MLSLQMQMRVGISPKNESACISNLICAKNRTAGFVCVTEKSNNFDVRFSLILDIRLKSGCQQIFIRLSSAVINKFASIHFSIGPLSVTVRPNVRNLNFIDSSLSFKKSCLYLLSNITKM